MIETQRLRLLPWKCEDWRSFHLIATDREVMRYITGGEPWAEERTRQFVDGQTAFFSERGFCRWRLEFKATGETAGFCGGGKLHGFDGIETGWWLARHLWGQGLATEAASAVLDWAFAHLPDDEIIAFTAATNLRSQAVMRRIGMVRAADRDFDHPRLAPDHPLRRHVVYVARR
jgi:RimJ/RimL family protein N-acetyltransferase